MAEMTTRHSEILREQYDEILHPSGLRVYVLPKKMSATYAVIATHYGSIDSRFRADGETDFLTVPDGVAHFLEHKMFENEDGEDTFEKFARFGGYANAYTSFDMTAYLFSAPSSVTENLEILLHSVTHPYFTEENVKKEQGIIGEELRMYLDNPGQTVYYALLDAMYENHPCKKNIGGTIESISHITPEVLYQCYRTFYRPDNMILCISGDIETDAVLACVDKFFAAPAETPSPIIRDYPAEPENVRIPLAKNTASIAQPIMYIGIKDTNIPREPAERSKKAAAMDILLELLYGKCSDFFNALYAEGLINGSLDPEYELNDQFSYCVMAAETEQPEEVLSRFRAYTEEMRQTRAISDEAFSRAKKTLYGMNVASFDSTEDIASMCMDYALDGYELYAGTDDLANVTLDDVYRVLDDVMKPAHIAASIIEPIEPA